MKKEQLKISNWSLIPLSVSMLASAVQLEITEGKDAGWVWTHILIGIALAILIVWHICLHYSKRWAQLFLQQTKPKVKFMTVFLILTAITGIIATFQWYDNRLHTSFGGIHGKLGFIFLFLAITHGMHYKRYYLK